MPPVRKTLLRQQMSFVTISNENNFFKTQGIRLGAIVAPRKGLDQAPKFVVYEQRLIKVHKSTWDEYQCQ